MIKGIKQCFLNSSLLCKSKALSPLRHALLYLLTSLTTLASFFTKPTCMDLSRLQGLEISTSLVRARICTHRVKLWEGETMGKESFFWSYHIANVPTPGYSTSAFLQVMYADLLSRVNPPSTPTCTPFTSSRTSKILFSILSVPPTPLLDPIYQKINMMQFLLL
jgi:hypothetical protein